MSLLSEMQADSPRGLWMLNGTPGNPATTVDSSGLSHTLTEITNTRMAFASSIIPTVATNCSDCDGAGGTGWKVAHHADFNLGDVYTLEIWAKFDSLLNSSLIYKNTAYQIYLQSDGYIKLTKPSLGVSLIQSSIQVTTGVLYHIVCTKNGSTMKMYINNVDRTGTTNNSTATDSSNELCIGAAWSGGEYTDAKLQAAAIYPTALSATRIGIHYNAGNLTLDNCLPDADVVTTGWTTAPLFSKINDASDATVIQATAS